MSYPSYPVQRTRPIFSSRQAVLQYEAALALAAQVDMALEVRVIMGMRGGCTTALRSETIRAMSKTGPHYGLTCSASRLCCALALPLTVFVWCGIVCTGWQQ